MIEQERVLIITKRNSSHYKLLSTVAGKSLCNIELHSSADLHFKPVN